VALTARTARLSLSGFIAWENEQRDRHEYVAGEVFAMTGARRIHNIAAGNIYALLRGHLRGEPCRAFMADVKVEVRAAKAVFYPDVFVTCNADDLSSETVMHHPKVIIEVLSDSTAAYDHGEKFASYRRLDSLYEYVLVDPEAKTVDLYRRTRAGDWTLATRDGRKGLVLPSLGFKASLAAVFEGL
jgi:Uma2 family endonuclease